jgi:Leucine-rich repeat (LRR) protein
MFKNTIAPAIAVLFLIVVNSSELSAQSTLSGQDIERYSSNAGKLVSFLEFTFNTIGNPEVPVKEKDIIINQSFSKFFENEKVQIEDDLDENREVPVNKDVQAYLKDIDFFYKQAAFRLNIEKIEHQINEKNQLFFKITLNRNLKGITVNGDTVDNNRVRYIEINLNDIEKDLKIASIYTTKLNEKEELRKWWNELPQIWKEVLGKDIVLYDTIRMKDVVWFNDSLAKLNFMVRWRMSRDTISLEAEDSLYISLSDSAHLNAGFIDRQLKKITALDTINISGISRIISLKPLSAVSNLKRIDCSHTMISELMPLRNLTHLEFLNISHTAVESLDALKYSTKMEELITDHTRVRDLTPVMNFTALKKLHMNHTPADSLNALLELDQLQDLELAATQVKSLSPVSGLKALERLDFSDTRISDLMPLAGLKNIYFLKFERTPVTDLVPLKDLSGLHFLFADQSEIEDISPLNGLPQLSKIYCDQTGVNRAKAVRFMAENPDVLVVYKSADLVSWWAGLTPAWQMVFNKNVSLMSNPSKEELHQIIKIKTLNIAGNQQILSLDPLTNLSQLKEFNCQGTGIESLEPLSTLADLVEINFSDTRVSGIQPLEGLNKLQKLSFDRTDVDDIGALMELSELKVIYCDNSPVPEFEIVEFMEAHPDCLVVYQTAELQIWWDKLPDIWKGLAEKFLKTDEHLTREQLQEIANLRRIDLADFPEMERRSVEIRSLQFIDKLLFLEELKFSNTSITSLAPLRGMATLKVLICPNNPIESLEPLSEVRNLELIDIQNTPIKSLEFLAGLSNLKKLNCSGTQIRKLKGLEYLQQLEQVDCYNTNIRRLKELEGMSSLKLVRCYNTRISKRRIEKFQKNNPGTEVVYY